ncbi:MAG: TIGR02452 family protein [Erysipelotrichaceae bacterium]|nr:TIGR02452 family protein [Erysipelotrichaceae bacterium]
MKTNNPLRNERKQKALSHTKLMQQNYNQEITYAIEHTHIYDENNYFKHIYSNHQSIIKVLDCTTTQAIIDANHAKHICALNFASFKNPGGGFYNGAMAQEEALCHDSFLYNVLSQFVDAYYRINRKDLNHSLYYNRALYSQNIFFFDEVSNHYQTDILTCAAPNYREASRQGISKEVNNDILKKRSQYLLDIASKEKAEVLILGAWGCGVFQQDPYTMATIFKELIADYDFDEIIFAVPKGRNHNYEAFKEIIDEKF